MHRLIYEGFMNPYWLNEVKDRERSAVAVSKNSIELLGKTLFLEGIYSLKVGETVYVSMHDGYFYFNTSAEKELIDKKNEQRMEEEKKIASKNQQRRQIEAATFNSRVKVPVKWKSVYKAILRGFSNNSGSEIRKNSVVHILLEEDLADKKFKRNANELLCCHSDKEKYDVIDAVERYGDIIFKNKITCKKCIEVLDKRNWLLE